VKVPTIFVADDDDVFRRVVSRELVRLGYRVIEAADGASALEALAACADGLAPMPDLVLLDVCMPEYSGLGVLALLRRFEGAPPAFIVTGFNDVSVDVVAGRRAPYASFTSPSSSTISWLPSSMLWTRSGSTPALKPALRVLAAGAVASQARRGADT
jgi:CheY-like chemotaxis protein